MARPLPPRQALALRQQRLLLRSRQLRGDLQQQLGAWQPALTWADRIQQAWWWLRAHPLVPLSAVVTLAVLRPRRAWRWGMRLWWGWRTLRRLGLLPAAGFNAGRTGRAGWPPTR